MGYHAGGGSLANNARIVSGLTALGFPRASPTK